MDAAPSLGRRPAVASRAWHEVFLDEESAGLTPSAALALAEGHSVLVQPLASAEECELLRAAASASACELRQSLKSPSHETATPTPAWDSHYRRVRMPVAEMLDAEQTALCERLLQRSLSLLPAGAVERLFSPHEPTRIMGNPELTFATGEPAINVYSEGGSFRPHEDNEAITILLTLSDADSFGGGGTGFWSTRDLEGASREAAVATAGGLTRFAKKIEPTLVLQPPAGSALCFSGRITHAGQKVETGERCVFVASFSPRRESPG